jgi:hippurate hydrolase
MPDASRISAITNDAIKWRRDFHQNPELQFDLHRTVGKVVEQLKAFGVDEIVTGIGRTGVVGLIKGRQPGERVIGIRADMDALPISEQTNLPHRSTAPGKMHACGHDGHTAILMGAARYLAETRNFAGTVAVIFQPAEEGGAGALEMCQDGLMSRFGIQEIYGLHNMPGMPVGSFAIRPGPIMAAADKFLVRLEGRGGHAGKPHETIDPLIAAAHLVTATQSITSRNADPLDSLVVSVTAITAGDTFNVIPQHAEIKGTVRTLTPGMRDLAESRFRSIVAGVASAFGVAFELNYERGYPVTFNHAAQADFAGTVAMAFTGGKLDTSIAPSMGAEDFSYMLEERPGAYIFLGNGDTAGLHHPAYDFNDEALPVGIGYWASLVETAMPAA